MGLLVAGSVRPPSGPIRVYHPAPALVRWRGNQQLRSGGAAAVLVAGAATGGNPGVVAVVVASRPAPPLGRPLPPLRLRPPRHARRRRAAAGPLSRVRASGRRLCHIG